MKNPTDWQIEIATIENQVRLTFQQNDQSDWIQIILTTVQTHSLIESLKKHLSEIKIPTDD